MLRSTYCNIPAYGQLAPRRGCIASCVTKQDTVKRYYSLMLKGTRRRWFSSNTFYLLLTEDALDEAIERGKLNYPHIERPITFGQYVGSQKVNKAAKGYPNLKSTFNCIFLHAFMYVKGGNVVEYPLAFSEHRFKRSLQRARKHPELLLQKKWWHAAFVKMYRFFGLHKKKKK